MRWCTIRTVYVIEATIQQKLAVWRQVWRVHVKHLLWTRENTKQIHIRNAPFRTPCWNSIRNGDNNGNFGALFLFFFLSFNLSALISFSFQLNRTVCECKQSLGVENDNQNGSFDCGCHWITFLSFLRCVGTFAAIITIQIRTTTKKKYEPRIMASSKWTATVTTTTEKKNNGFT